MTYWAMTLIQLCGQERKAVFRETADPSQKPFQWILRMHRKAAAKFKEALASWIKGLSPVRS